MKKKTEKVTQKALSPFDIIGMMFKDKESFNKLSNLLLEKNYFMINRVLSIKYPFQAQCFNMTGINLAEVVKAWNFFLSANEQYGKIPGFVFTRGAKKTINKQEVNDEIKKSDIEAYAQHYHLSIKDVQDLKEFNYNALNDDIKNLNKLLEMKTITSTKIKNQKYEVI